MVTDFKIISAYRNQNIPERFLNTASQKVLDMFKNQVCVGLQANNNSGNFGIKYEIEDEIRNLFIDRIYEWIKSKPTIKPWSIITHGFKVCQQTEYQFTFGFISEDYDDSEKFYKEFLVLEKLSKY
jgi:hypothetical protein